MVIKDGLGNTCWKFRNKPIVLFTLVKIVLIWMSNVNFESKCRPKCFWKSALLTGMLLKNILGWIFLVVFLLKMTSWACFVGSGLKFIFHWKAHLFIFFRSWWTIFHNMLEYFQYYQEIDLFASRLNAQLLRFFSYRPDPFAEVTNAFSVSSEDCLPLFACIGKILQKSSADKATGLLVVPNCKFGSHS